MLLDSGQLTVDQLLEQGFVRKAEDLGRDISGFRTVYIEGGGIYQVSDVLTRRDLERVYDKIRGGHDHSAQEGGYTGHDTVRIGVAGD